MNYRWSKDRNMMLLKAVQVLQHASQYEKVNATDIVDKAAVAFGWTISKAEKVWAEICSVADQQLRELK